MKKNTETRDVVLIQNFVRFLKRKRRAAAAFIPAAAAVLLLLNGIYTVAVNERGAMMVFGRITADDISPGIHFRLPRPLHRVEITNVDEIRSLKLVKDIRGAIPMITGDENIIEIGLSLQYKISGHGNYLTGAEDWENIINLAAVSSLTELIAGMRVDEVLTTGKSVIQAGLLDRTQRLLDEYSSGINLFSVSIENIQPPAECRDSFRQVSNARNEKAEKINMAESAGNQLLSAARGEAAGTIRKAEAEAQEIVKRAESRGVNYSSVYREYLKAPEYTVDRYYYNSLEKIIEVSEIVMLDSSETEAINLNHYLACGPGAVQKAAKTDNRELNTAGLYTGRTTAEPSPGPAPEAAAAAEPVSKIVESSSAAAAAEKEVRRRHSLPRR